MASAVQLFAEQPVRGQLLSPAVDRAGQLAELAAKGALTVPFEVLPLDSAAEALDRQSTRQERGGSSIRSRRDDIALWLSELVRAAGT